MSKKWPLIVNKGLFWWSATITLDNNNAVLTDLQAFFSLNTLPHTSVSQTSCISLVFSVLNILLGHFNKNHGLDVRTVTYMCTYCMVPTG